MIEYPVLFFLRSSGRIDQSGRRLQRTEFFLNETGDHIGRVLGNKLLLGKNDVLLGPKAEKRSQGARYEQ
jgi:hypothetical protein